MPHGPRQPQPPEYVIRNARPEDADAVLALLAAASLPLEGVREGLGDAYAVAELGGRCIGAQGIEVYGPYGLLRSAVVAAAHQGAGVGTRLTRDRLAWAGERSLRAVYLITTTAAPFFARLGFRAVARDDVPPEIRGSWEYSVHCPSSATVMMRAPSGEAS